MEVVAKMRIKKWKGEQENWFYLDSKIRLPLTPHLSDVPTRRK
jgi:hypothetical protein